MSLRSALKYLEHKDQIMWFVDYADFESSSGAIAKHALQFMVRGISTSLKQPVGHFFIGNSVAPEILKKMIL